MEQTSTGVSSCPVSAKWDIDTLIRFSTHGVALFSLFDVPMKQYVRVRNMGDDAGVAAGTLASHKVL